MDHFGNKSSGMKHEDWDLVNRKVMGIIRSVLLNVQNIKHVLCGRGWEIFIKENIW